MAVHEGNPMRKAALSALAACLLFASLVSQLWAQGKKPAAPAPALKVGDVAPDFKLQYFQQNLQKLEAADTQVLGVSMDSPYANKAFADQIGVKFPLLSDWGGEVTRQYGIYMDKYKAARRVNFLIGKDGKILEEQVDSEAIDPTKIVAACERRKLKD